jgi:hypothetical protein
MEDFDTCDYHECGNLTIKYVRVINPAEWAKDRKKAILLPGIYIAICPKHQFILNDYLWEPISRDDYIIGKIMQS